MAPLFAPQDIILQLVVFSTHTAQGSKVSKTVIYVYGATTIVVDSIFHNNSLLSDMAY
jgi:hypothetical protein